MSMFFTIAGFLIVLAKDVIGLDISIQQLKAVENPPAISMTVATPTAAIVPPCASMLGIASAESLNQIELARATGKCR